MEVVVDGIIYRFQSKGGISRAYNEILPRMCELDDSLVVTLLSETGELPQLLPVHERIIKRTVPRVERYLRPSALWMRALPAVGRLTKTVCAGGGAGKVWHSTYYTLPGAWRGTQVVTVFDMIYERFADLFERAEGEHVRAMKRRAVMEADAIICISEATQSDVQEFYHVDPKKIFVVPLAQNELFRPLPNGHLTSANAYRRRPFLLYVGRRAHYKNFDLLLEAYGRWPRAKEVDLVVVSDVDWTAEERRQFDGLALSGRIHLLRGVDDASLQQLYAEAAAFVYPSLYEGFGIPLLEALACGCPVIASDIPSSREVAGECAVFFDPSSVEGVINALDFALDEGRNSSRQRAGWERAAKFSWDETARRTLEVYRQL